MKVKMKLTNKKVKIKSTIKKNKKVKMKLTNKIVNNTTNLQFHGQLFSQTSSTLGIFQHTLGHWVLCLVGE